jgi:N6-adenosine-specific RNA methylase IME4
LTDLIRLPGETSPTGWRMPDRLSERQWKAAGEALGRAERAVMWWIGDWWAYGEHRYGDRRAIVEAPGWTGPSFQTCVNAATVCRRFESNRRREVLSFKHHAEVAALPAVEADRLLDSAEPAQLSAGDLRNAVKRVRRETREVELAGRITALPNRRYGVVLADPEWRFEPWSRATGMDRSADNHYPTSPLETIKARDVPSIAAEDCVLFLWATAPMLPQALEVIAAWGFAYRSHFVWVKDVAGTGYWNRNRHELLLIGVRGAVPCPAPGEQWDSVIEAPAGAHSAKPAAVHEMIEAYFPTLPKTELNRRGPPRPGWDAWGNEVDIAAAE